MRLSILAVVVFLALGAGLLAGCDRDATTRTTPGSGASSSSDATTPSTQPPAGGAASGSSAPYSESTPSSDTEKKQ